MLTKIPQLGSGTVFFYNGEFCILADTGIGIQILLPVDSPLIATKLVPA